MSSLAGQGLKRAFDVVLGGGGLIVCAIPFVAIAGAIKLDSEGPIFYRGERVGRGGDVFRIFKFRTMVVHDGSGPSTTSAEDPRVTRVGRVLRRLKLDELPQLINVVRGDMSFVGPRPEVKWCVDMYSDEEREILTVRPGITDWASIRFHDEGEIIRASGYEDADEAYLKLIRPEKLRLQLQYVRERSARVDWAILAQTARVLFRTRVSEG